MQRCIYTLESARRLAAEANWEVDGGINELSMNEQHRQLSLVH
jgi:hypothetical protein